MKAEERPASQTAAQTVETPDAGAANDNPIEIKAEEQPASQTTAQAVAAPDAGGSTQATDEPSEERSRVWVPRTEQDEARRRLKSKKRAARKGVFQYGTEHE